jgi:hypothetical protein
VELVARLQGQGRRRGDRRQPTEEARQQAGQEATEATQEAFWQWYGAMLLLELPLIGVLIKLDDLVETDGRDVASRLVKVSTMKVVIALLSLVSAWFIHRLAM